MASWFWLWGECARGEFGAERVVVGRGGRGAGTGAGSSEPGVGALCALPEQLGMWLCQSTLQLRLLLIEHCRPPPSRQVRIVEERLH